MKKSLLTLLVALLILILEIPVIAVDPNRQKGTVYWDRDRDGKYDRNEPGLANVCVSNGREVVLTDSCGHYILPTYAEMTVFTGGAADLASVSCSSQA
ncbi:MAG: hypothetical protein PVH64_09865 [Bacillota bacterium]